MNIIYNEIVKIIRKKTAAGPYLSKEGLSLSKLRRNQAAMLYKINLENNTSKFYEILIVKNEDRGSYTLLKKWGRLTDRGSGGRVDGTEEYGLSLEEAKEKLNKVKNSKIKSGYVDAYGGENHINPKTGNPLTKGEYPISPHSQKGFGWGTQEISNCVSDLRKLQKRVDKAKQNLSREGEIENEDLMSVLDNTKEVLSQLSYSKTGQTLLKKTDRLIRRLRGDGRFAPDPDGSRFLDDLVDISIYLEQQLAYCD